MLPKIKRFIKTHKKQVRIGLIVLAVLIILIVLYKSLFYSNSEKATYGVRLTDIEKYEFTDDEKDDVLSSTKELTGVKDAKITVKGRLIKFFVYFDEGVSTDDIQARFNDMLGFISDKVKSYYDVTFYSIQEQNGEEKYPVTGYKHKNNDSISFDVL